MAEELVSREEGETAMCSCWKLRSKRGLGRFWDMCYVFFPSTFGKLRRLIVLLCYMALNFKNSAALEDAGSNSR